eukprot:3646039-Rhodomonas_salina.1
MTRAPPLLSSLTAPVTVTGFPESPESVPSPPESVLSGYTPRSILREPMVGGGWIFLLLRCQLGASAHQHSAHQVRRKPESKV